MLKRVVFPVVLAVFSTLASAQNDTTNKQPAKKSETPTKTTAPRKPAAKPGKPTTSAKEASLKVGAAAPALRVESWVKGRPVRSFEKGRVYLVEFWATWCPPCEKSIPHLTKLQEEFKGLTVIGVASSERKEGNRDRRLANLERWVNAKGKQMGYTVGYEGDQQMFREWMTAAGESGIPWAFVVDGEGKITWIGFALDKGLHAQVEKAVKSAAKKDKQSEKKEAQEKPAKPGTGDKPEKGPEKPADSKAPKKDEKR